MKRYPITEALLRLGIDTDEDISNQRITLLRWAKEAEKKIGGVYSLQRKAITATVEDNSITFPQDAITIINVLYGDQTEECLRFYEETTDYATNYSPIGVDDNSGVEGYFWDGMNGQTNTVLTKLPFEIEAENINLMSGYDGETVTIQYWQHEVDIHGNVMVNESHLDAIVYYLQHKLMHKNLWTSMRSDRGTRQDLMMLTDKYKLEFRSALRRARAEDATENEELERARALKYFRFPMIYDEYI
jgi:hypothetical protein